MSKATAHSSAQPAQSKLDPARLAAKSALLQIWQNGGALDEAEFPKLTPPDRARALRLSREVLRNETGFDRVIKAHAARPPAPELRAILHLGSHELLIDQGAPHGVIHAWVEIAKTLTQNKNAPAFVNAILRKIADERPKLIPTNQFGKVLRAHLMTQYSSSELDHINKLQSVAPPLDLRVRKGENLADWAKTLNAEIIPNTQSLRLFHYPQISSLPGFAEGRWWVQDVGASLAADALGPVEGQRVLDLCAAPGGKTLQLTDQGAKLTALDVSKSRSARISENLARTHLDAEIIIQDALTFEAEPFDAILLDAPCSATGTIRRHPELRFNQPLERMASLIPIQAQLLEHAYSLLKPSGRLIYCTCSLLHEEGEAQIEAFLSRHPEAKLCPILHPFSDLEETKLRLLPTDLSLEGGCDGFFIAKLQKPA